VTGPDDDGPLGWDEEREQAGSSPERPPGGGPAPRRSAFGGGGYGWIVGVAALLILIYVLVNSLRTNGPGAAGLDAGTRVPPFATPLASGSLDGDANVARHRDQGQAGKVPACEVRGPQVVTVCPSRERRPLVIAFRFDRAGADCDKQVDELDRARVRHPEVRFVAISIRGDRGKLRERVRERRWRLEVGWDRDGAIANVYGIAVCPTVTFAYARGKVMDTTVGLLDQPGVERELRRLLAGPRRAGTRTATP
jgi:hypothetical protein